MARPSRSRVSSSRNQASSSVGSIFTQLNRRTACASLRAVARCHAAHADSGVERSVVSGKSLTGLFTDRKSAGPKVGATLVPDENNEVGEIIVDREKPRC